MKTIQTDDEVSSMFMLTALISILALHIILALVLVILVQEENSAVGHARSGESTSRFLNANAI